MKPEHQALLNELEQLRGEMRALQAENYRLKEAYEAGVQACYQRAELWEQEAKTLTEGETPENPTKIGVDLPEPIERTKGRALALERSAHQLREATDAFASEIWPSPSWSRV
jgi:hypothetical protein